LLETIREFAFGELAKSGQLTAKQRLHANWCARLAEAAEPQLTGPTQVASLELLEREHDNLLASLRWTLDGGDPLLGVRLASAMGRFWEMRGYLHEAHQWLERAVSVRDGVPIAARANLCRVAGHVAFLRSEYPEAQALLEESLDLSRGAEDPRGVVQALINLALLALMQADDTRASTLLREGLQVATNVADNASAASSLNLLGLVAYHRGQLAEAQSLLEQSLELSRSEGNAWGTAQALCHLGQVLHAKGFEAPARALHLESLQIWRELSDDWGLAYALEGFALLFGRSSPERAVRLIAVATGARERVGIRPLPGREKTLQQTLRACEQALGAEAHAAAWSAGQSIGLDAAIEDVVETIGHA
jgi:non-specific serine/threonine protein kinase